MLSDLERFSIVSSIHAMFIIAALTVFTIIICREIDKLKDAARKTPAATERQEETQ